MRDFKEQGWDGKYQTLRVVSSPFLGLAFFAFFYLT
jgi:hypothetical protein